MIETHGLRRTFQSRAGTVEAVAGVDLHVDAGELFGFLGTRKVGRGCGTRCAACAIRA